ncbi:MAG TPA: LacI family DNA-binding transcriptional regulator [Anaerolineaceae bacterium]
MKKTTISQVAAAAGVSPSTVSLILNGRRSGDDRISDETRQRVLTVVADLGYVPNQTARILRRKATERICLWLVRLGVPYNDLLSNAVQEAADQHGYSLIICTGSTAERQKQVLWDLRRGLADGVLVAGPDLFDNDDLTDLARSGVAVVAYSNTLYGKEIDVVRTTEYDSSQEAVEFLVSKGHKRIGYIGLVSTPHGAYPRFVAYRNVLMQYHLPFADWMACQHDTVSRDQAYRCSQALIAHPERPTAIFCSNDLAAISTIWAIRDAGLRVPEDVAVVGAGNIPDASLTNPPLTTIGPPTLDFSMLIHYLFSRLLGEAPAEGRIHTIQWQLIQRASV